MLARTPSKKLTKNKISLNLHLFLRYICVLESHKFLSPTLELINWGRLSAIFQHPGMCFHVGHKL